MQRNLGIQNYKEFRIMKGLVDLRFVKDGG